MKKLIELLLTLICTIKCQALTGKKLPIELMLDTFGEGDLVNTTVGYRNVNNGTTEAFNSTYTLEPGLKTFYDTDLLENTREKRVFAQFGQKQPLPKNKGKTVEWRKWKTLPPAMKALVEGVRRSASTATMWKRATCSTCITMTMWARQPMRSWAARRPRPWIC